MSISPDLRRGRRGLSFLEFIGCLSALAGGAVLGSMYLGVDVKETTFALLERAQVVAQPADPAPTAVAPGTPAPASNLAVPSGTAPLPSLPGPTQPATPAASQPAAALAAISLTPEERKALTQAYWDALQECVKAEAQLRQSPEPAVGGSELHDYLSRRSEGHRAAAEAIDQLSLRGVDAHVAAYAESIQAWHEEGASLFAEAQDLLTDAPTAQLSGPFAQGWQSAATQHQMEERLLEEKHRAVQSYLEHAAR
jgi:hypothetical protein